MSDALVFPSSRAGLFDLIDGTVHEGAPVTACYHLQVDERGSLKGPFPLVHIHGRGGTQGFVDRVERRTIDVYAEGEMAERVLQSITAFICGANIGTPSGFFDSITCDSTPEEADYPSDTLNQATAAFLITARPIN